MPESPPRPCRTHKLSPLNSPPSQLPQLRRRVHCDRGEQAPRSPWFSPSSSTSSKGRHGSRAPSSPWEPSSVVAMDDLELTPVPLRSSSCAHRVPHPLSFTTHWATLVCMHYNIVCFKA